MAIDTAATLTTTTGNAIKNRYYDEMFLRVAEANMVYQQLGQLNRQIPKGQNGASIFWTRWVNLTIVSTAAAQGVPTTANVLSAVYVSGTSTQYDNAVSISDLMAQYSFGDVMKAAMQRLAYNAGLSIDTLVRNTVAPGAVAQYATNAASITAIPATGVLTIAELRKAKRTLEKANAFRVGGGENPNDQFTGNGYWVAVVSPDQAYDIEGDSTTGAWIDSNRYAGSENIFAGEIGKLYGIRFMETSNGYKYLNSAVAATGDVHTCLVAGSDLFGVTTAQNLQTFIKDFGSGGVADPTNKVATAGWKCTFGTTILNSSFGVSLNTDVTS